MILTFCGHSDVSNKVLNEYKEKIMDFLEKTVGNNDAEFYLGGYGKFDDFAFECCKEYQKTHLNVKIVFVTPYLSEEYQKRHLEYFKKMYDYIVYPPIEKSPLRFAIKYRNIYMVDCSDWVISYVVRNYGGAYNTFRYAQKKNKKIYNLE